MNVLKVFNKKIDAVFAQESFALDNFYQLMSSDKFGKVKLLTGHSVYFVVINSLEDCHKFAGHCFSWVEYKGVFDPDIKQWIANRIRGVPPPSVEK